MTDATDEEASVPVDDNTLRSQGLSLEVTLGQASFRAVGDSAAVLDAFGAFQEFYAERSGAVGQAPLDAEPAPVEVTSTSDPEPIQEGPGGNGDSVPLSVFLARKKLPRGNHIIALGIAVWARRFKGEEVFTAETMKAFWRDSKKKVPANIPRDLGAAASEGWLERLASGAGNYGLTSYGEAHFDGLPSADA